MIRNNIKPTLSITIGCDIGDEPERPPLAIDRPKTEFISADIDAIVEAAWSSLSVDSMLRVMHYKCSAFNRYMLLQQIIRGMYSQREDEQTRLSCIDYCEKFRTELPGLLPGLKNAFGDNEGPGGSVYKHYATILTEDGSYQEAIDICEEAIDKGMDDGTKTGFEGRIARIMKKQERTE